MFGKNKKEEIKPDKKGAPSLDKFRKPKKRSLWKFILLAIFLILIGAGGWIGYTGWNAIKNVTADSSGNHSFFNFLKNLKPSTLAGESDNRINVLIIGNGGSDHPGGLLADTIMVASFKPNEKQAAFISIPRDLYVPIEGYGYGKINAAHSYGETHKKSTGGGPALMKKTVSNILGIPIQYYIRGDFYGFKKLVDKMGGIDVYVKNTIYDSRYPDEEMQRYTTFYVKKGWHHMDGTTALKYARSRHSTSDFDRSRRQQQIILAMKEKAFGLGLLANPKKLVDILNIIGDHVRTDMSIQDLQRFAQISKDINQKDVRQLVLDNGKDGLLTSATGNVGYYLKPRTGNYKEIQAVVMNIFNQDAGSTEGASIEIRNGTGQSGHALQAATLLKTFGYSANAYMQSVTPVSETVLYDYSNGKKPFTAEFLKNYFHARIESGTGKSSEKDFVLILGSDYIASKTY